MVNNFTNIHKANNHLSHQINESKQTKNNDIWLLELLVPGAWACTNILCSVIWGGVCAGGILVFESIISPVVSALATL